MVSSTLIVALAGLSTFAEAAPTVFRRGSSKLGYAFGKAAQGKIDLFSPAQGCWGYDWEARVCDSGADMFKLKGCEFVPMLHDTSDMFVNAWKTDTPKAIEAGSKHLLSFNEPDHCGAQSEGGTCIPIDVAVSKHKELMDPYCGKDIKIGSPAVTNGDADNVGLKYLSNFMDACKDCQIDFINIHWQWTSGDTPVKTFTDHVQKAHDMFGKDIWVTEYQAPAGSADPVKFMKDATAWLDKQSYVKRYAYFSVNDKLTNGDALNDLGVAYAGM